jgi:type IV pilus assembly protein PilW
MVGFSLIEVLVSMVIALITFLVMFQMFESWDKNKRTTASGGGAIISGALAMFRLERDLHLAGFGFGSANELGCTVTAFDTNRPDTGAAVPGDGATASHTFSFPLVPLQIIGANGPPQRIVALYGSSEGVSSTRFFGTATAGAQPYTAATTNDTTTEVGARSGIRQGDLVILAQDPTHCNLVEVTDTSNTNRRTFAYLNNTAYHHFYTDTTTTPRFNPANVTVVSATGNVYVMGPRPQRRIWGIRNNRTLAFSNDLNWTDTVINATGVTASAPADNLNDVTDVADNIVNIQAQYGFTGAATGATPPCAASASTNWTADAPAESCLWPFLWAVRVALLARSDQFEKAMVTAVAPTWAGGSFGMTNLDGSAGNTVPADPTQDWRHYRYKVFESIIPLKNVMWGSR